MVSNIMEIGIKGNNTVKGFVLIKREQKKKGFGKMENLYNGMIEYMHFFNIYNFLLRLRNILKLKIY